MAFREQNITTGKYLFRFLKFLARPGSIGNLKSLLNSRMEDEVSMVDFLERHAVERPNSLALKFEDQQISWSELNRKANQMAHYFRSRGVTFGDKIALNIENRPELLFATMGCLKIGAVAGMVNTGQTNEALAHSLRLIEPRLIIVGTECLANMETVADMIDEQYSDKLLYIADGDKATAPSHYRDLMAAMAGQAEDNILPEQALTLGTPIFYIFTSGTTGLPKASITTHMKVFRAGTQFGVNVMSLKPEDTYYCALPLYHSNALTVGFGSCLSSGATLALRRKFSASQFWQDCIKYEATAAIYIGELLRYLLAQPVRESDKAHNVTRVLGNGLRPDIWMEFKNRFGIGRVHEFYGASEGNTGFVNIFNFDKTVGWSPQYGKAWDVVQYDVDEDQPVRGDDAFMKRMGVGDTGLLIAQITEQNPFDGYTDAQASEKKILRDVFEKGDAWFNTGDLVVLQKHGHIQFGDRIGDTFRWQGENVATTEVESVIMKWPEIEDAVVYGVTVPGRDGRCGMLYLTQKEEGKLDLNGLAAHMRDKLPSYAVPRFIRIGQKVDVTGTFKFQKTKLKNAAYKIDEVDDPLYVLARDADGVEPINAEVQGKIDNDELRL
ncbi:MAG: long-chain-acyl-CoA synthetase [Alphaproteobacteria bacterium]|nr:long-chain-acyl-CoA synthetase [Alphaproteobacteria bacterium]